MGTLRSRDVNFLDFLIFLIFFSFFLLDTFNDKKKRNNERKDYSKHGSALIY